MNDLLPDLCDQFPHATRWIPIQWQSFGQTTNFWGEVVTVRCFDDNSFVRRALSQSGQGKVLVVDGHASLHHALLGDRLAVLACENAWEGIIVYGAVRDAGVLNTLPIGIKALGVCPIKTEKRNLGEENVVLNFGGTLIYPRDHLYADANGVICSREPLLSR